MKSSLHLHGELNSLPWVAIGKIIGHLFKGAEPHAGVAHDVRGQPLQHEEHLGSASHGVDVNTINAQYLLFSHANL